jgi:hypothetical protein
VQLGCLMERRSIRRRDMTAYAWPRWIFTLAVASLVPLACATEGPGITPPERGTGAADGSTGGAQVSAETSTGSGDSSTGSGQEECPYTGPPPIDPSTLEPCPSCSGGAHCVPTSLVPAEFADQLADCDTSAKCVPDPFIVSNGLFIPDSCSSVAGAEGRCLSVCLPDVAAQAAQLPQDVCPANQLCVPCYDPTSAATTGACELSCDPGPAEPPSSLPKCCDGMGTCVPPSAAGENADKLGEDSCPQDNGALLCAPDVFVNDPMWSPASCTTSLVSGLFGSEYEPGACLPDCLPDVDNFLIQKDDCADGFKCAPCLEPPFGQPSGACDL